MWGQVMGDVCRKEGLVEGAANAAIGDAIF